MRYRTSLIKNPNGTYSFVGSVPCELVYLDSSGNPASAELVESQHRLPSGYRSIKARVFSSRIEAWGEYKKCRRNGWTFTYTEEKEI